MRKALRILALGRVQGVWYRASTEQEARRLGLVGWVRNRSDGSVEALVEGEQDALEALAAWCRRGPPLAVVEHLDLDWGDASGGFEDFVVAPTV